MAEQQLTKKERKALKKKERAEHQQREVAQKRAARKKTSIIVVISAVVIIAFLAWLINNAPETERIIDETPTEISPITSADNIKGALEENAKITIIEYSDFECPACAQYFPILKLLLETYGNDVRFVYRHLPLQQIHLNAMLAASYSEAAALQGKFFEMHDLIFENQGGWAGIGARTAENMFTEFGESLGLDLEQLKIDADSDAVKEKITVQRLDAIGAGAVGTPTFFVDGVLINNPRNYVEFETLVLSAIGGQAPTLQTPTLTPPGAIQSDHGQ